MPSAPKPSSEELNAKLQAAIQSQGGIDAPARADRTLLLEAVITRDTAAALKLLKLGANPNVPDGSGFLPLFYAVGAAHGEGPSGSSSRSPSQKLVRALLNAGADPNAHESSPNRYSPLQAALSYGRSWCSIELVKAGANPLSLSPSELLKAQQTTGFPIERLTQMRGRPSPLIAQTLKAAEPFALLARQASQARALSLSAAAKAAKSPAPAIRPLDMGEDGEPEHTQAESKPKKRKAAPKRAAKPTEIPTSKPSAAPRPALSLEESIAQLGVNGRTHTGDTLLLRAIITHDIKGAMRLLSLGADPNLADSSGRAPLLYACGTSYRQSGDERLEPASLSEDQRLLLALLDAGADPNLTPPKQPRVNPLEGSLFYRNIWCCLTLIRHGARLSQLDEKGKALLVNLSGADLSALESLALSQDLAAPSCSTPSAKPRL